MKEHPADAYIRARLAVAVSYTVHFLKGPHERYNEPAGSLAEAEAIAARMNAEHGALGRRAIVYAIMADGTSMPMGGGYETAAMRAKRAKAKQ